MILRIFYQWTAQGCHSMYLRDNKILFIHLPRNAGQSVTVFFYSCLGILDQFANANGYNEIKKNKTIEQLYQSDSPNERYLFAKNNHWKVPGPLVLTYMTLQEYVDYGYIPEEELLSIQKLVTVRNPYERIISACNHRSVAPHWSWIDKTVRQDPIRSEKFRHFCKQSDFIKLNGEVAVDEIVKLEEISKIPSMVSDRIDVGRSKITHYNKRSEDQIYKRVIENRIISARVPEDMDRETIDWINDYYHEDFERFGYEKI